MSWIRSLFATSTDARSAVPVSSAAAGSHPPMHDAASQELLTQQDLPERQAAPALPESGHLAKRAFDVVCALIMLVVLSPLLAIIALLVICDGGSCVFGHTRIGQNGVRFKCLKFRSMVVNADAVLKDLLDRDPAARAEWERDFKLKDDIRITRIGRFIRNTSLDELPQLWNVVRGDMSLVGPRPIVEAELQRYGPYASYYLITKPGITGLWQISGRSDIDYASRVLLDVSYVTNRTFAGDVRIMFKTVGVVLHGRGAY
jgi:Undecaprenyl-phosphate galactose phosphotransferase WbaP